MANTIKIAIYKFFFLDSSDDSSNLDEDLPKRKFVFTFSVDEWNLIKPHDILYRLNDKNRPKQNFKSHQTLQKNQWTPILAEHFWIHTQLPCCISFKRAHVYRHGNNFVTVIGRCSVCSSHFKGVILNQPSDNAK